MDANLDKPVTVMIIGAGGRGRTYANYADKFPKSMKVVAVSDLNTYRRNNMAKKHGIAAENQFGHYNEALSRPKLADAVVIATPDNLHYEPCMKALELGYDVLLEKPVAPTEKECRAILKQAHKYNRIVAVCHVLRYAPYFVDLKKVIDSGAIGDVVSVLTSIIASSINVAVNSAAAILHCKAEFRDALASCIEAITNTIGDTTKLSIYFLGVEAFEEVGTSECALYSGVATKTISEETAATKNGKPYKINKRIVPHFAVHTAVAVYSSDISKREFMSHNRDLLK
jgi:hypothetical protein